MFVNKTCAFSLHPGFSSGPLGFSWGPHMSVCMCLWVFVGTQTFSRRSSCPACPWSTCFNVCTYSWVLRCWWMFECSSGTRSPFWILMGACLSLWVIIGPPAVSLGFLLVLVGHCGAHVMVVRHCEFLWVLMGGLGGPPPPQMPPTKSDSLRQAEIVGICRTHLRGGWGP